MKKMHHDKYSFFVSQLHTFLCVSQNIYQFHIFCQIPLSHISGQDGTSNLFFFLVRLATSVVIFKGTLGGFFLIFLIFCGTLPGRESNPGCWDRIPASYHFATLTPICDSFIT